MLNIHQTDYKKYNRLYLIPVIALLCIGGVVIYDSADIDQDTGTWTSGDCTVTLDENGVVTVTGDGAMANYSTMPSRPWHSVAQSIKSVIVEDGVTAIGNYSFQECYNIESVTVASATIGQYAFRNCTSLSQADLGNTTSIGHYSFQGCTALTRIVIPSTVTNIYASAFQGCLHTKQIFFEASSWGITLASQCFSMGTQSDPVSAIVFSPDNMAGGKLNSYAGSYTVFRYASLSEMWVSGDTQCMLDVVTGVFTVNKATVEGDGAMADYENIADVPWAQFKPYITEVVFGNGVTKIGQNTFNRCANLTSFTFANSVTSIGVSAFQETGFTHIDIPDTVLNVGNSAFSRCYGLTTVLIGNGITVIPRMMFEFCSSLESVQFGDYVRTIDQGAFYQCTSLESVTLPDTVTTINSSAFYQCYALTSVELNDGLVTIGPSSFRNCTALTQIEIPATVTTIGQLAFDGCYSMVMVLFKADTWAVETIGANAFSLGLSDHRATCVVYSRNNVASGMLNEYSNEYTVLLYSPIPNYAVTIRVNNSQQGSVDLSYLLVERGTVVSLEGNKIHIGSFTVTATPSPATAQYTYSFSGWSGIPLDSRIIQDTTITANFIATINSYTVSFEVNDAEYGSVDVGTVTADYGTPIEWVGNAIYINDSVITATPNQPTAQYRYVFDHWDGIADTVTGDITITAVFNAISTNTVTYHGNGGEPETQTEVVDTGQEAHLSDYTCTREGYEFLGWAESPTALVPISEYVVTADSDLYAVWKVSIDVTEYYGDTEHHVTETVEDDSITTTLIRMIPILVALQLISSMQVLFARKSGWFE